MTAVTVTLNPAVDKTYVVPHFILDRIHRPAEARTTAGGKGVNVARVLRTLGMDTVATGFLSGTNGDFIAAALAEEGIPADFVRTAGESRVAIKIADPEAGTQTEINEAGPHIEAAAVEELVEKLRSLLGGARWLVLSGSIPPGVPTDIYVRLIRLAKEAGVRAALDTSGEPLRLGIRERPYLAKPNRLELSALGIEFGDWEEAPAAAERLRSEYGVELSLVSGGTKGAVLATPSGCWSAVPPPIEVVSAVGSGDSLAAAFLWALDSFLGDYAEALRWGAAAGVANAQTSGAGYCSRSQIEAVLGKIEVEKHSTPSPANNSGGNSVL